MRKIASFIIVLLTVMAVSCGGDDKQKQKSGTIPDSLLDLRIGVMPTMDCLPLMLAQERGWFDKHELKVRLLQMKAQMDVDTALAGCSADIAITDSVRYEAMKSKGVKLDIWASAYSRWQLVANRKSRLTKPEQFGGKLVGMTRSSATSWLCDKTFTSLEDNPPYYIQINDINIRSKMLQNGEVDAAWLPEPWATASTGKGCNIVNTDNDINSLGLFAYRTDSRYNTERGKKLRLVYNEACDSINKNGVKAYYPEIAKWLGTDTMAIKKLGNFRFKTIR